MPVKGFGLYSVAHCSSFAFLQLLPETEGHKYHDPTFLVLKVTLPAVWMFV